jgi:hypothetical protein
MEWAGLVAVSAGPESSEWKRAPGRRAGPPEAQVFRPDGLRAQPEVAARLAARFAPAQAGSRQAELLRAEWRRAEAHEGRQADAPDRHDRATGDAAGSCGAESRRPFPSRLPWSQARPDPQPVPSWRLGARPAGRRNHGHRYRRGWMLRRLRRRARGRRCRPHTRSRVSRRLLSRNFSSGRRRNRPRSKNGEGARPYRRRSSWSGSTFRARQIRRASR